LFSLKLIKKIPTPACWNFLATFISDGTLFEQSASIDFSADEGVSNQAQCQYADNNCSLHESENPEKHRNSKGTVYD
jgi:hypothetical protein